jgi:hypothetical protein
MSEQAPEELANSTDKSDISNQRVPDMSWAQSAAARIGVTNAGGTDRARLNVRIG